MPSQDSVDARERLGRPSSAEDGRVDEAVRVATALQRAALGSATPRELARSRYTARLARDPSSLAFVTAATDQGFRARGAARAAGQVRYLIARHGEPAAFSTLERAQLKAFRSLGPLLAPLSVPAVLARIRRETAPYLLPAEPTELGRRLAARAGRGVQVNLNLIGEATLGDAQVARRLQGLYDVLARPDVDALSVKVSSIASHLELVGWERTLEQLVDRLSWLYEAAMSHPRRLPDGRTRPKLVNLDMEAYHDLPITMAAFQRTLSKAAFAEYTAGLALQAYLPESFALQRELTAWAEERVRRGGAPIRVRLVKGANLAAERVEASLRGFAPATYATKAEVDANFKRMVEWGCRPEVAAVVRLGIASHNVFDIAWAVVQRAANGVEDAVGFEMLEGMNEPLLRAVAELTGEVLVYAPAVARRDMESAIAYLIRRLDENTGAENFLSHGIELAPGSPEWGEEEARFRRACADRSTVSESPRRTQDRTVEPVRPDPHQAFGNEPDTDFTRPANRRWLAQCLRALPTEIPETVPLTVAGEEVFDTPEGHAVGEDPSRPGVRLYRTVLADWEQVDRALATAREAARAWSARPVEERSRILAEVAHRLRCDRGHLITWMVADAGKAVLEADAEVSEAIDFAEYYRRSLDPFLADPSLTLEPRGVVLVTPPWNFPLAIPAGGVLAALAAGNAVLLKPARETALVAHRLATSIWGAGVPRDVLQFVPCRSESVGSRLVADPRVDAVVLTGSTATARAFLRLRPDLHLLAETGGKNATIVTAMADRDLAIQHVLRSAFGHAGQKCSATSLLICEAEVYDDATFRQRLADAASSLPVGSAWDPSSVVTPLIRPPGGPLAHALTELDAGEEWLVRPRQSADNPRLWSPGIKLGVARGSLSHRTELFGPVLSMMRAESLEDAIEIANDTPYGLTGGLESLDPREHAQWLESIDVGNAYVNRGTTGAVVRRQPFGGRKGSSFGPGAKAGGPNYTLELVRVGALALPREEGLVAHEVQALLDVLRAGFSDQDARATLEASVRSFAHHYRTHFAETHDPSRVLGEDNFLRYQRVRGVLLVGGQGFDPVAAAQVLLAGRTAGIEVEVDPAVASSLRLPDGWSVVEDPVRALGADHDIERVRMLGAPIDAVRRACLASGAHFDCAPPVAQGRVELLHYLREQAVSIVYHRYGNLGERARDAAE